MILCITSSITPNFISNAYKRTDWSIPGDVDSTEIYSVFNGFIHPGKVVVRLNPAASFIRKRLRERES